MEQSWERSSLQFLRLWLHLTPGVSKTRLDGVMGLFGFFFCLFLFSCEFFLKRESFMSQVQMFVGQQRLQWDHACV